MQVRTELKRKLHSWRTEAEIVCCGQWLAVSDSRVETLSIAMVPEQQRSLPVTLRPVAAGSSTLGRSLTFRCEGQWTLMHLDDSLLPVCGKSRQHTAKWRTRWNWKIINANAGVITNSSSGSSHRVTPTCCNDINNNILHLLYKHIVNLFN